MLQEFANWFKTKNSAQQRAILVKLDEVFQIQNNFGYIEQLKTKLAIQTSKVAELEKQLTSDIRYKEACVKIGKLESYIQELEDERKVPLSYMYSSIPEEERKVLKQKVTREYLYMTMKDSRNILRKKVKEAEKKYQDTLNELIKLKQQSN